MRGYAMIACTCACHRKAEPRSKRMIVLLAVLDVASVVVPILVGLGILWWGLNHGL